MRVLFLFCAPVLFNARAVYQTWARNRKRACVRDRAFFLNDEEITQRATINHSSSGFKRVMGIVEKVGKN